jgi:hypothetical protein
MVQSSRPGNGRESSGTRQMLRPSLAVGTSMSKAREAACGRSAHLR